jgi:hypothetical protein
MAKLHFKRNGEPYLTHGYPIIDKRGQEDTRFCTYHLNPRAEHLFERAGVLEGDRVLKETFYALLVEGNIYNEARPKGIEITSVPKGMLLRAEEAERELRLDRLLKRPDLVGTQYLIQVFDTIRREYDEALDALSASSWFFGTRGDNRWGW